MFLKNNSAMEITLRLFLALFKPSCWTNSSLHTHEPSVSHWIEKWGFLEPSIVKFEGFFSNLGVPITYDYICRKCVLKWLWNLVQLSTPTNWHTLLMSCLFFSNRYSVIVVSTNLLVCTFLLDFAAWMHTVQNMSFPFRSSQTNPQATFHKIVSSSSEVHM